MNSKSPELARVRMLRQRIGNLVQVRYASEEAQVSGILLAVEERIDCIYAAQVFVADEPEWMPLDAIRKDLLSRAKILDLFKDATVICN